MEFRYEISSEIFEELDVLDRMGRFAGTPMYVIEW